MTSISGLSGSGLDTNAIISQLMQIERRTQSMLQTRQSEARTALSSYQAIRTAVSGLQSSLYGITKPSDWNLLKATSSDETTVGVTAGTASITGSIAFTVDTLAVAASRRSQNTVATLSTQVATGPITLTRDGGTPQSIEVGDGSLQSVVNAINAADAGVVAAAVKVGDNAYRLQVTAAETGAGSGFTLDIDGGAGPLGTMDELAAGGDAQITVGSGPGAYTVTSSSNTIEGLLPGLTVQLEKTSATAVTVGVERDGEGLADKIQAMVDQANAVLAQVKTATSYDAEKKQASPLTGDSTVRRLAQQVVQAISAGVDSGNEYSAGLYGVSLTREGTITFDRSKFLEAISDDHANVASTFSQRGVTTDPTVQFVSANHEAQSGTYAVVVTQAAAQATEVGLIGTWPITTPPTVHLRVGGVEVTFTIGASDTAQDVADGLNSIFAANDFDLVATAESGGVALRTIAFGSDATFDVSWDSGGNWGTVTGADVAGTIGGIAATGTGKTLSVAQDDTTIPGLSVEVNATAAQVTAQGGAFGTITYAPGVAQRLTSVVDSAIDFVDGYLTSATTSTQARIDDLQEQIDNWDRVLAQREQRLRLQFATLETTLGALRSQSSWLSSQIAGLGSVA